MKATSYWWTKGGFEGVIRPWCLGTKGVSPSVPSGLGYQSICLFSVGYSLVMTTSCILLFELIGGLALLRKCKGSPSKKPYGLVVA